MGAFSALIRAYTNTQYQLHYNKALSDSLMQQASDQVAENLLINLLGQNPLHPELKGKIPKIEEISNVLDIPVNTVKTRLRRAKQRLETMLKEAEPNER